MRRNSGQGLSSGRLLEPRYVTLTRVPLSRGSAEASPTPPVAAWGRLEGEQGGSPLPTRKMTHGACRRGASSEPRYVTLTRVPLSRGSPEASPVPPAYRPRLTPHTRIWSRGENRKPWVRHASQTHRERSRSSSLLTPSGMRRMRSCGRSKRC